MVVVYVIINKRSFESFMCLGLYVGKQAVLTWMTQTEQLLNYFSEKCMILLEKKQ